MKFGILLAFQNIQEVNKILTILIFRLLYHNFIIDLVRVYDRSHGFIKACISDSLAYNVPVPFNINRI